MVQKWLFTTLSEVLTRKDKGDRVCTSTETDAVVSQDGSTVTVENAHRRPISQTARERLKVEREWTGAIAALETLLLQTLEREPNQRVPVKGLVLAGPVPVLSHPSVISHLHTGIFTAEQFNALALMPFQLPPAPATITPVATNTASELSLLPADPLADEQFCLVLTSNFSLVMVLGEDDTGTPSFQFSFDPEAVQEAWRSLRARVLLTSRHQLSHLDNLIQQFPPIAPDYRIVMQFSRYLLKHLPEEVMEAKSEGRSRETEEASSRSSEHWVVEFPKHTEHAYKAQDCPDVELLQALTHEIRTPLTTIRTLTRSLLKRRDLAPDVLRRLEVIDHECTEQINRMELIFRAVEVVTSEVNQAPVHLSPMSLGQLLQQSIPRWQKQALRRNVTLDVVLPQKLPAVVSNPLMLDQVLTGLMENFTRTLPTGGHIQVEVTRAGDQLKLQLQSLADPDSLGHPKSADSGFKSIGQLLMFQPETGSLSLNLNVTKNLFQVLGGKLIVRQRPQQGEVLTIFLPLELGNTEVVSC